MANILFLAHRIPYPPNKGDKIRSWNFLKHLLKEHEVHLAFFVDAREDEIHIPFLRKQCTSLSYAYASPLRQKFASLRALVTGKSQTECAYPSQSIRKYIASLVSAHSIDLVFAFSAATYAWLPKDMHTIPVVTDIVDVDSAKWAVYGDKATYPMRMIYRREARYLSRFEARVAEKSAACLLVSDDEANLFKERLAVSSIRNTHVFPVKNGVDCAQFSPAKYNDISPSETGQTRLIFTGAMDYQPNIEAAIWFADKVLPLLHSQNNNIEFVIAGGPVADAVQELSKRTGITVLGRVTDMAEEIQKAHIVIAPLQTARGIQNKVLEGMAMAKPVVATAAANEGINAPNGSAVLIADTPNEYSRIIALLNHEPDMRALIGNAARTYVEDNFSWAASWHELSAVITAVTSMQGKNNV